jgi:hypothetical protein
MGRVTISERIEAGRREQRVLTRVCQAAWRLEQAERERAWALVSARAEGISIRKLATAAGLSPSRVHQLVAAADPNALDAAPGSALDSRSRTRATFSRPLRPASSPMLNVPVNSASSGATSRTTAPPRAHHLGSCTATLPTAAGRTP